MGSTESFIFGTRTDVAAFKHRQELMYVLGVHPRIHQRVTPRYSMSNGLSNGLSYNLH